MHLKQKLTFMAFGSLNNGYILKSIEDLPQIPESGYSPNSHRQIRVITEFSDEARTHPAYGRRADPPVQ